MDKEPIIAAKNIKFDTPQGQKSIPEICSSKDIPANFYFGEEKIAGRAIYCKVPYLDGVNLDNLNWAIKNFDHYDELKEEYQKHIDTDPAVKWHLIPCLLLNEEIKQQYPNLASSPIPPKDLLTDEIKVKINALNQQGAEYWHYIIGYSDVHPISKAYFLPFMSMFDQNIAYNFQKKFSALLWLYIYHLDESREIKPEGEFKIAFMLQSGVDLNLPIDNYNNSIFLYLIALEQEKVFINFFKLIFKIKKKYPNANTSINFLHQDIYGKTALLFAVGLGLEKVVDVILRMSKFVSIDQLGLNTPDSKGRTPAMIAAALGRKHILELLIACGCNLNLKDKQGRDINYYKNAPEIEVKDILESVSIHPDRAACIKHSFLYANESNFPPLVLRDENHPEEDGDMLVVSPKPEHFNKLCYVYKKVILNHEHLDDDINSNYIERQLLQLFNSDYQLMSSSLSKSIPPKIPTVLEECLANQTLSCKLVDEANLRIACAIGDVETVKKILLETKADPLVNNLHKMNALACTIILGIDQIREFALIHNLTVSPEDCIQKHAEVFQVLLERSESVQNNVKNAETNGLSIILTRQTFNPDPLIQNRAKAMLKIVQAFLQKQEQNIHQKQDTNKYIRTIQ